VRQECLRVPERRTAFIFSGIIRSVNQKKKQLLKVCPFLDNELFHHGGNLRLYQREYCPLFGRTGAAPKKQAHVFCLAFLISLCI